MISEEVVVASIDIPSALMPFQEQRWLYNSIKSLKTVNEGKAGRILHTSTTEGEFNNEHLRFLKIQFCTVLQYQHMLTVTCTEIKDLQGLS